MQSSKNKVNDRPFVVNTMKPVSEQQVQNAVAQEIVREHILQRLGVRRVTSALILIIALGLFLLWLPLSSRQLLINSLIANRFLITLLALFALMALSLLWSRGQTLDLWLFKGLTLRGAPAVQLDRLMWVATQLGNVGFAIVVAVLAYILNNRRFAIGFALGSLTLLLLVTILKAITDRARPFKLMLDTRVVGFRELGLSFPSGHTTQTFFMMTIATLHFQLPLAIAAVLYGAAVLVGITRVYLGVHYPRDVIAGAILGIIWGMVAMLVAPYL
jgi:membrane-associated phospholipid phosphatase